MCNDSLLLGQNGLYACLENTLINTCFDKYMYRYVGHVSAIERSDLDQVLCRKRPTVAARDEVHHSVWCSLDVPHLARLFRLCRGQLRPCSRRIPAGGAFFVFLVRIFVGISYV